MKRRLNPLLALLVIAALALATLAAAEEPAELELIGGIDVAGDGELNPDEPGDLALGELVSEGSETADAVVVYRFIVNDAEYAVQEAREGEAVACPETPVAPEGMTFEAWVLADGAPLFVDVDGDGAIDPVVAHVDEMCPEITVWARFAQVEAQPAGEVPAEEVPAEEQPAEEVPAEEVPAEEVPAEEVPVEEVPAEEVPAEEQPAEEVPAEEQPAEEQPAEEVPAEEVPAEEVPAEEVPAEEVPAEEQPTEEVPAEEVPAEEAPAEEAPAEEVPAGEQPAGGMPVANALVYTGEAQPLVSAEGAWLYSLDGETFSTEVPTAIDAGEYTVYYKGADGDEARALVVTVEKADVEFIPPVAATGEE